MTGCRCHVTVIRVMTVDDDGINCCLVWKAVVLAGALASLTFELVRQCDQEEKLQEGRCLSGT